MTKEELYARMAQIEEMKQKRKGSEATVAESRK
jgi:hypothetical protein